MLHDVSAPCAATMLIMPLLAGACAVMIVRAIDAVQRRGWRRNSMLTVCTPRVWQCFSDIMTQATQFHATTVTGVRAT